MDNNNMLKEYATRRAYLKMARHCIYQAESILLKEDRIGKGIRNLYDEVDTLLELNDGDD